MRYPGILRIRVSACQDAEQEYSTPSGVWCSIDHRIGPVWACRGLWVEPPRQWTHRRCSPEGYALDHPKRGLASSLEQVTSYPGPMDPGYGVQSG